MYSMAMKSGSNIAEEVFQNLNPKSFIRKNQCQKQYIEWMLKSGNGD